MTGERLWLEYSVESTIITGQKVGKFALTNMCMHVHDNGNELYTCSLTLSVCKSVNLYIAINNIILTSFAQFTCQMVIKQSVALVVLAYL